MKSIELLGLIIKVSSIYLLLQILAGLFSVYSLFQTAFEGNVDYYYLAWFNVTYYVMAIILFLLLWNFPVRVAKFMLPTSNDERFPAIDVKVESLELVLYSGIGVALLAVSIPDLGYNVAYYIFLSDTDVSLFSGDRGEGEALISIAHTLGRIVIGSLLCVFAGNFKLAINKIRGRT